MASILGLKEVGWNVMVLKLIKDRVHGISVFLENGSIIFNINLTLKEYKDASLLTGFLAGIVSFSRELGSEPSSITVQDGCYYLWKEGHLIFALNTTRLFTNADVEFFKTLILSHPKFEQIKELASCEEKLSRQQELIMQLVAEVFADVLFKDEKQPHLFADEHHLKVLNDLFARIMEKKIKSSHVAEKILATSLRTGNRQFINQSKRWFQSIVNNESLDLDEDVRQLIVEIVAFLENEAFMEKRKLIFGHLMKK